MLIYLLPGILKKLSIVVGSGTEKLLYALLNVLSHHDKNNKQIKV